MKIEQQQIDNINAFLPHLDERLRRMYLASEAEGLGRGGATEISKIFNIHQNTLTAGKKDLHTGEVPLNKSRDNFRIRRNGAGRKPIQEKYPGVIDALNKLVDSDSFGNPENPLRWTTKSLRNLQVGKQSPDRDAQFRHINDTVIAYQSNQNPVISIDCKKKENIGNFKNNGAEYAPKKNPRYVLDHDFPLPELGKALPYGVYDIANNEGFVNVGISKDTAEFAVQSIRSWWNQMGKERFPCATGLYITADGGGSNGNRCRLWRQNYKHSQTKLVFRLRFLISLWEHPNGTKLNTVCLARSAKIGEGNHWKLWLLLCPL